MEMPPDNASTHMKNSYWIASGLYHAVHSAGRFWVFPSFEK